MNTIEIVAAGILAYLGYKAFTQGIPASQASQDATAMPKTVRKVVRRRVSA